MFSVPQWVEVHFALFDTFVLQVALGSVALLWDMMHKEDTDLV